MKKSLLALAAMGAFAGAAQAQSSVTVYGILDVGYQGSTARIANNAANSASGSNQVNAVTNTTTNQFGDSAQSTSRLGFRGTEDLGGGLSAFFTIETAITPNAQQTFSSSATANRQTFAGLAQKGLGRFSFGTQYTIIHNAAAATDPGQLNNMAGNVIYDKVTGATMSTVRNSSAASSSTGVGAITQAAATQQFTGMQNNTAYTVRSNNMLFVQTEYFSGLRGNAFYVQSGNTTNATAVAAGGYTGGQTNNTGWGLGADFTWQKLLVTANFQNFTNKNPYTIASGAYTVGQPTQNGFGATSVFGVNSNDNQQYYAATYDFGILKAYVQFVDRKTTDVNNGANYIRRTAQQIGVRGNITKTVEGWASAGNGKFQSGTGTVAGGQAVSTYVVGQTGGTTQTSNFSGFQLGTNYWLSKRTNLYAIYGQQSTANSVWATNAAPTSYNLSNYALGVRHTF